MQPGPTIANCRVETIRRIPETGAAFDASYHEQTNAGPDPGVIKTAVTTFFPHATALPDVSGAPARRCGS